MSRIAFCPTGWVTDIDADDLDYRCFFPPGSSTGSSPDWIGPSSASGVSFPDAFAFFWKIKTMLVDWNFTGHSGSEVRSPISPDISFGGTEQNIMCKIRGNNTLDPGIDFSWYLNGYNAGTPGTFGYGLSTTMANLSFDPARGWPDSGIVVTFLGYNAILYGDPAGAPYSGFLTVTPLEYWEYRDNDGNNPIFDSATGAQLIFPIPVNL